MNMIEMLMHTPFAFVGVLWLAGLATTGLWLSANHTWVEFNPASPNNEKIVGLILWPLKCWVTAKAMQWDKSTAAGFIRVLLVFGVVLMLASASIVGTVLQKEPMYLWGLVNLVGLIAVRKTYKYLSEMLLSCFRCMPTGWFGVPVIAYLNYMGFTADPSYLTYLPWVVVGVAVVSMFSTFNYMLYAMLKTKVEVNSAEKTFYQKQNKNN